jgi:NADH:ubiquinone oxidoreductase subunit E
MNLTFGTKFDLVCDILDRYNRNPESLIAILQEIQDAYSYLPEDIMTYVATALSISPGTVFGVATFYAHFTLEPKGKYVIKVCDGTACHIRGSARLLDVVRRELEIEPGGTTADMLFSLKVVNCLGACALAPAMLIDDEYYGGVTADTLHGILEGYKKEFTGEAME